MKNRLAATLMVGALAVAATGTGVAIGSSTSTAVKACASKSTHHLGLIKNGKCAPGFKKVTLGATGPRGKTGPQGPGAIELERNVTGDDLQATLGKAVSGVAVHVTCSLVGNPSIALAAADSSQKLDLSGTGTHDEVINVSYQTQANNVVTENGTNYAAFDVIIRAGTAPFTEIRVSSLHNGDNCLTWVTEIPTKASS